MCACVRVCVLMNNKKNYKRIKSILLYKKTQVIHDFRVLNFAVLTQLNGTEVSLLAEASASREES